MRKSSIAVVAAAAALLPAGGAHASTIEVTASAGPSASEYIEYRTSKRERNRVRVHFTRGRLVLVDKGTARIRPKRNAGFGACRATGARRVVCPGFPLFAFLRDGNDRLSVAPGGQGSAPTSTDPLSYAESYEDTEGAVTERLFVDAGSGDDFVSGSSSTDTIFARSGSDHVQGRDGADQIYAGLDTGADLLDGGGDVDAFNYETGVPLTVDLAAGTARAGDDTDTLRGFERVHGSDGADTLRGSDRSEALYGERGGDVVDGRGGNDLLVGDSPIILDAAANHLIGGDGDDVLDTRVEGPVPTSIADCGPGLDRYTGSVDTLVDPFCEAAAPRVPFGSLTSPSEEDVLFADTSSIQPVAKTADSVTFDVACPRVETKNSSGCGGLVLLERPPAGPQSSQQEQYGSSGINLAPGQRGNVTVPLNSAGQAAVAGSGAVAVRIRMELKPAPGSTSPARADVGWQADL